MDIFEKFKLFQNYAKFQDFYNKFAIEVYEKVSEIHPLDEGEELIKIIPLNRILSKFTEVVSERFLILTNKKLLDISNTEDVKESKVEVISYSHLKKIAYFSHKIQFFLEDGSSFKYQTIYSSQITHCVKHFHSKDYYTELKISKCKI
jgi:hypothetical protein